MLNQAVDTLLKKEFDSYRDQDTQHPWQIYYKIGAKPYQHPKLATWRHNFKGVRFSVKPLNFEIFGAVDDLWQDLKTDQIYVVDYKATVKEEPIKELFPTGGWHDQYRRQMEIYQWLLAKNNLPVANKSYFVFANGDDQADNFLVKPIKATVGKLDFAITIFDYQSTDFSWVDDCLKQIKQCLDSSQMPNRNRDCKYCLYATSRVKLYRQFVNQSRKPGH